MKVIQGTLLVIDHVHSRPVVTVSRPVPPVAPTDGVEFETLIAQRSVDGPVTVFDEVPHATARKASASAKPEKMNFIRIERDNTESF